MEVELNKSEYEAWGRHDQWMDVAAVLTAACFLAGVFIPTIGKIPFAILAVAAVFTIFRVTVWRRIAASRQRH